MSPQTRRRFLQAATAVAGGLAGCSDLTHGTAQSSRTVPADEGAGASAGRTESDPPVLLLRADSTVPPLRLTDPDGETTESVRPEEWSYYGTNELIDSQSRGERLAVGDGVDGEKVSSFVSATEFDSETLYLETTRVEECFRLRLCHVSWEPDEVQTDYVRVTRPYDERCSADERVYESRLIRFPVALDEDSVTGYGSSIRGSGPCRPPGGVRAEGSSQSGEGTVPRSTGGSER